MPTKAGMSSFWPFEGVKSFWGSKEPADKNQRSTWPGATPDAALGRHRPLPHTGDQCVSEAHTPVDSVDSLNSTQPPPLPHVGHEFWQEGQREAQEARAEAVSLREALQRAEEKLAEQAANQRMIFPVLEKPITAPQLEVNSAPYSSGYGHHASPVPDKLSITAPPAMNQASSMARGNRFSPVEVEVETMMTAPASASNHRSAVQPLPHCGSMRTDEACWRVRHLRCDNAKMPTALRGRPSDKERPLQDITVLPHEEVLVLESQSDPKDPNCVWTKVACAKGEGWMKRMHLKEGGWRMRHVRGDSANIPTALRERPTATAKPLQAVKAEPHEELLVHVQMEVQEGGRSTTWARVACQTGEGWIKREHLLEALPPGNRIEELPDDASETRSAAVPSSPRSAPGGSLSTTQSGAHQHTIVSLGSPMQSRASTVVGESVEETGSECPATGVRIHLGMLEFVGTSATAVSIFDTVSFRAAIQLGGAVDEDDPPARWLDNGPHTGARTLKYGRSISEDGRYGAKVCCQFDEAIDLPWPPPGAVPDKIAVDIYVERTSVADHFDRVLGNLGLHTPAGLDRRWLGRAVADLPPEGVDDTSFAWQVEGPNLELCPLPQTMSVAVEWVYQPLESL